MTFADWRALLEAFVDGRIGPDAFQRRFMEGWRADSASGAGSPRAIEALVDVVQAYQPDFEIRKDGDSDEQELEDAARRALRNLTEEGALSSGARTYDRARTREDIRRFQIQMNQLVGFGCLIALVWVGLCALQVFAVSDQIQSMLHWPAAPATFAGVVLAFVPVIGNVLAFFGATDVWHWNPWAAGAIFFAAPAATIFSGWMRWWRRT